MKTILNIRGKSYNVEIAEMKEGKVKIKVGEKEFIFEESNFSSQKEDKKKSIAENYLSQKKDFEKKEIKSPIAGIVSEIFVKKGQDIKKGQKLILLSAMKMENEIVSDFQGKVKKVCVKKDQKVKGEDVLIFLE